MLIRTETIENGDVLMPFNTYKCERCSTKLPESAPREDIDGNDYCGDCAFILGLIDEKIYLKKYAYWIDLPGLRAAVHEDKIYIEQGKFPWERTSGDRNYQDYSEWRTKVFERDDYTCQKCGQRGGQLNAHHKKPFSKYPDLRTDLNNGITLCVKCHRETHRNKRKVACANERS